MHAVLSVIFSCLLSVPVAEEILPSELCQAIFSALHFRPPRRPPLWVGLGLFSARSTINIISFGPKLFEMKHFPPIS